MDEDETSAPDTAADESAEDTGPSADVLAAKITELEGALAESAAIVAERDAEIVRWKAANYDLLLQVPAGDDTVTDTETESVSDEDDSDSEPYSDLFE